MNNRNTSPASDSEDEKTLDAGHDDGDDGKHEQAKQLQDLENRRAGVYYDPSHLQGIGTDKYGMETHALDWQKVQGMKREREDDASGSGMKKRQG
jgi:hypothetical protein